MMGSSSLCWGVVIRLCFWKAATFSRSVVSIFPSLSFRSPMTSLDLKGSLAILIISHGWRFPCSCRNFSQQSLFFFLIIFLSSLFCSLYSWPAGALRTAARDSEHSRSHHFLLLLHEVFVRECSVFSLSSCWYAEPEVGNSLSIGSWLSSSFATYAAHLIQSGVEYVVVVVMEDEWEQAMIAWSEPVHDRC